MTREPRLIGSTLQIHEYECGVSAKGRLSEVEQDWQENRTVFPSERDVPAEGHSTLRQSFKEEWQSHRLPDSHRESVASRAFLGCSGGSGVEDASVGPLGWR